MMTGQPIYILKEGTERTVGRDAQRNNIFAAKTLAEAVRSALGPRGMDKMLIDQFGDVTITNDGATILKEIDVVHPGAKFIIELAKTQDQEVGDGTTSVVVLAGELLKRAEELLDQDIHASIIVDGLKIATEKSIEALDNIAIKVDPEKDEEILLKVAMTSMSSKLVAGDREKLAKLLVDAVKTITVNENGKYKADINKIKVEKKQGGSISDTILVKGVILDKEVVHDGMPKTVKNAKILLINEPLEITKTEFDAKLNISSPEQMQAYLEQEQQMLKEMADKIIESGANVVFAQKGIDDVVQHYLAKAGIMAVRRVKKSDIEALARATGGKVVSSLKDLDPAFLGEAELVEERIISDDKMVFVEGCKDPKAVTILVRGGTELIVDEAERAIHDALSVIRNVIEDGAVVAGGGSPEIYLANVLEDYAKEQPSKIQLAVKAFSEALRIIPKTLAENGGMDPIEVIGELNKKWKEGKYTYGVDPVGGKIADMKELGVLEPIRVKKQMINSAAEAAQMILRIDDVIAAKSVGGKDETGGMDNEDMDF